LYASHNSAGVIRHKLQNGRGMQKRREEMKNAYKILVGKFKETT
jgi:hypothetical protein